MKNFAGKLRNFWLKIKVWALFQIVGKEVREMAIIYCTLILKKKLTFSQVFPTVKEEVRQMLIDLDRQDLIIE